MCAFLLKWLLPNFPSPSILGIPIRTTVIANLILVHPYLGYKGKMWCSYKTRMQCITANDSGRKLIHKVNIGKSTISLLSCSRLSSV